jgi:polar amino acid transport system substrate-binding protein
MRSFRTPGQRVFLCAVLGAVLAAAACAPEEDSRTNASTPPESSASATAAADPAACAKDGLQTRTKGKLTIATDQPVYEPWFVDDKPENGKGFESAVAYAVAKELGFETGEVSWARVRFNNAIQPGPKDFDFDINEFTITDERKKAVDFSSSYYDATQAVIALKSSKLAGAKSIADLKAGVLGAQVNTTSYDVITNVVKPSKQPQVFPNNDNAKRALQNGSIDALVVDLPTAFYMTGAEIENSVIIGQVEQVAGESEQFGLVLDKGSPLTPCVTKAVDSLRGKGTLDQLSQQWLADVAGAPVLK